jgi:hypothetical protein
VARREVSDTPLQALTLLNDTVFMEAAQALGRSTATLEGPAEARAAALFRHCLVRPASDDERRALVAFYSAQRDRLARKELDAAAIAAPGTGDPLEPAAWTIVARALLNLDEMVVKD